MGHVWRRAPEHLPIKRFYSFPRNKNVNALFFFLRAWNNENQPNVEDMELMLNKLHEINQLKYPEHIVPQLYTAL